MRRWNSDSLASEALAHENLTARQGLAGKCWCLVCAFFVCWGLKSVLSGGLSWRLSWSDPAPSSRLPWPDLGPSPPPEEPIYSSTRRREVDPEFRYAIPVVPEDKHLGVDYSLVCVLSAGFAILVCPWLCRDWNTNPGYSPPTFGSGPMPMDQDRGNWKNGWLGWTPSFGAAGGGAPGNGFGNQLAPSFGAAGANGFGTQFRGPNAGGFGSDPFLNTPASSYSLGSTSLFGNQVNSSLIPPNFGSGNAFGSVPSNMPLEAELAETYNSFGRQLEQWLPRLCNLIERTIVAPLIQEIEDSDNVWNQALTSMNWRLTCDMPRQTYPGMGMGLQAQELSIFDPQLPPALQQDPRAVSLWNRRQTLENYLKHPLFSQVAETRTYVLHRLREWRTRGLLTAMRFDARTYNHLPTDGHILENVMFRMLSTSMDFENSFLATSYAPPLAKHMGQSPPAYLRQVSDQTVNPKPPPHYEVFTHAKVWKIRQGNTNLLEALQILLHTLKQSDSRLYRSFPEELRGTLEDAGILNLPFRIFNSVFG